MTEIRFTKNRRGKWIGNIYIVDRTFAIIRKNMTALFPSAKVVKHSDGRNEFHGYKFNIQFADKSEEAEFIIKNEELEFHE